MSTAGIDERLARLAPTTSPDPARLDAARAALDDVLDGTNDGTGPSRSRRVGDAHVLDLDDARARRDGHDGDDPLPLVDDDVVVPLRRGRTVRERRRRRVQLGAAAAGVVGIVAVGLVLAPQVAPGPASSLARCESSLTAASLPDDAELELRWRTLVRESRDGSDLMLLREDAIGFTGFCADDESSTGSSTSTTLWSEEPPTTPAEDEVAVGAVQDDEWYVVWGVAGADVRSVRLLAEWSIDGLVDETAVSIEPRQAEDGLWSVFVPGAQIPAEAEIALEWRLADGGERSMALDSAWPEPGVPGTPLADARRHACVPGGGAAALRPVLEGRHGDGGLTVFADDDQRFVACLQEAVPPYGAYHTLSGSPDEDAPAKGEAKALLGGGDDDGRVMIGLAGADVARVEVLSADGSRLRADLNDGYWAAWASHLDEDAWDDARIVWYLDDGSRHQGRAFS
ncbi:hypothetical protein ACFQ8T_07720 [Isoptericola sp. NPDC056618]|uniref:hypothetical protein n=1 Tax=Isoptericola sp. NPDC056618 TaxID=3345878 RepID=UPI0036A6EB51